MKRPKHLLPIVGIRRCWLKPLIAWKAWCHPRRIFVITNQEQKESVLETCPSLIPERVIGEPVGRDTAAAVGLAALLVEAEDENAAFALLPADHVIEDGQGFRSVLSAAFRRLKPMIFSYNRDLAHFPFYRLWLFAKRGRVDGFTSRAVSVVDRFVEKPDLEKARQYLDAGNYFWNAGMFVWRPSVILKELLMHAPGLSKGLDELKGTWRETGTLKEAMEKVYPSLEKISIDFAVMEKAERVVMLESDFDWDDVGEWPAITRHYDADGQGNVFKGRSCHGFSG